MPLWIEVKQSRYLLIFIILTHSLATEVSQFLFKETLGNANFRKILALSNVSF